MANHNFNSGSGFLAEPSSPSTGASPQNFIEEPDFKKYEGFDENSETPTTEEGENEQNKNGNESISSKTEIPILPIPIPIPIPIPRNKVYGRYRSRLESFSLELRVDFDGPDSLKKVSGDFFQQSGLTTTYFGSFTVESIVSAVNTNDIVLVGIAKTTWLTAYNKVKLTIKRTLIFQPLGTAQLQWINPLTGAFGASYPCTHFHRAFRTVELEQDYVSGVIPFSSYNTGLLPSGGAARAITVNSAYQEAGIEVVNAGITNVVPIVNLTSPADKWSDAELHAAMVSKFSLYSDSQQWKVWLLHAYEHERGPGLLGIMFDQQGRQRQGCAVFYRGVGGTTAQKRRLQLYTCVHELGHCFNLLHSWQKSYATPPKPNIPRSLSWMNYPFTYPDGEAYYWNNFNFKFDPVEVAHIRHGFRNNVIMGGSNFAHGSSLHNHDTSDLFEMPIENHSPLFLELEAKRTYLYGEPIVVETKLKSYSTRNIQVVDSLHADYGFVTIGIKKPNGETSVYEPLGEKCLVPTLTTLNGNNPSIYESSYIGFDKSGFVFDQIGNYQIKAVYVHEDGSRIVSNTISLRVKSPVTAKEDEIADIMLQEDIGYLLNFKGSDADYLSKGRDSLQLLIDKHKDHAMTSYAQFVTGVNAQRTFKTLTEDQKINVRQPDYKQAEALLTDTIEKSKDKKGLDNISLNEAMQVLAKTYQDEGNTEAAKKTANDIVSYFDKQPIKKHVKDKIKAEANAILNSNEKE